jgi:hypothetical protein
MRYNKCLIKQFGNNERLIPPCYRVWAKLRLKKLRKC